MNMALSYASETPVYDESYNNNHIVWTVCRY